MGEVMKELLKEFKQLSKKGLSPEPYGPEHYVG